MPINHAERDRGELGVEVVDELGDPGLAAGRGCRASAGEQPGEVAGIRGVSRPLVARVTMTCGLSV